MDVPEEADRLFESGLGHFQSREDDLALNEFTKVLELWPNHVKARIYRALIRYRTSDSYGVLRDILDLLSRGVEAKELFVLMAHLMMENGSELWERKARETASMGIPVDLLDGAPNRESSESTTEGSDGLRLMRDMRRRVEREIANFREDENIDQEESRKRPRRYAETEIVEGQIRSVGTFRPTKKLKNVVGLEKAKQLIQNRIILPLEKPELFARYKKKPGLVLLLYGPPGCGKTLLADAVAGETGATLLPARIHELNDMYVGNSEKNIHTIFQQAQEIRKHTRKPVIVFIDELDGLGGKRDGEESRQWARLMVNQLMVELDGLEKTEGLIVIGATNQPWAVDPALKRSGRFGDTIYVPPPDLFQRKKILENYLKRRPAEKLDFDELAQLTEGFSGADIERVVDHAFDKPMQRESQTGNQDKLRMEDIREVLEDKELGGNTLDDWWAMLQREIERDPRDKARFEPLLDDLKKYLDRKRSDNPPQSMAV